MADVWAVKSVDQGTTYAKVDDAGLITASALTVSGAVTPGSIASTGAVSGTTGTFTGAVSTAGLTHTTQTGTVGSSTAAAGTTVADAGALPAGTGNIYPTTAADDTKGVKVSTSDKVTGRMIFIGNGVSNKILKVYGPSGAVINGAAADAAFSSASGGGVIMFCLSGAGNTWLAW